MMVFYRVGIAEQLNQAVRIWESYFAFLKENGKESDESLFYLHTKHRLAISFLKKVWPKTLLEQGIDWIKRVCCERKVPERKVPGY